MDINELYEYCCDIGYNGEKEISSISEFLNSLELKLVQYMDKYYVEPRYY